VWQTVRHLPGSDEASRTSKLVLTVDRAEIRWNRSLFKFHSIIAIVIRTISQCALGQWMIVRLKQAEESYKSKITGVPNHMIVAAN